MINKQNSLVQPNKIARGCDDDDIDSVKEESEESEGANADEDWMFKTFDKNKQRRQASNAQQQPHTFTNNQGVLSGAQSISREFEEFQTGAIITGEPETSSFSKFMKNLI